MAEMVYSAAIDLDEEGKAEARPLPQALINLIDSGLGDKEEAITRTRRYLCQSHLPFSCEISLLSSISFLVVGAWRRCARGHGRAP